MIPARRMVWALGVPVILAIGALFEPQLVGPMIAVDLLLAAVVGLDAWLSRGETIEVERRVPDVVSVGRPFEVSVALISRLSRPVLAQFTADLPADFASPDLPGEVRLEPMVPRELAVELRPERRGGYDIGATTLRWPTRLGFWTRQLGVDARDSVRVFPDIRAVYEAELMARRTGDLTGFHTTADRGGETEFDCLREYRPDDEYRTIDWRATARRQQLIARQYQLEEDQSIFFCVDAGRLMSAKHGELDRFDHALNAALVLGHVATRAGDLVGLCCFRDDVVSFATPKRGKAGLRHMVEAAYDVSPTLRDSDFELATRTLESRLRARSLVIVFTALTDAVSADALTRSVRHLSRNHVPLVVVFREAELEALARAAGSPSERKTHRAQVQGTAAAAAHLLAGRQKALQAMERAGALVLDVATHGLAPALIRKYLHAKAQHLL